MDALTLLEQKVVLLVERLTELKTKNSQLVTENEKLSAENNELRLKSSQLTQEREQLVEQLDTIENSLLQGSRTVEDLNLEKNLTRAVVDDLIKSIDALVENEQQQ